MRYPKLVCGGHGEYTPEERHAFDEFFTKIISDVFGLNVESSYVPHSDYPYTTDALVYNIAFPQQISGRASADGARITADGLTVTVYKKTPRYCDDGTEVPDKYFSAQVTVHGTHIPYHCRTVSGFTWPDYSPYFHGSTLEDLDVTDELKKIATYMTDLR